jgi:phage replication O-like protein O
MLESGFTGLPNNILDKLAMIRIPGEARQVLDVIIRQTYGWNRETDAISLSQLQKKTGMERKAVTRAVGVLEDMNLIHVGRSGGNNATGVEVKMPLLTSRYSINKDSTTWKPKKKIPRGSGKKATGSSVKNATGKHQKTVAKMPHTKEKILKTKPKKEYAPDSVEYRLALLWWESLEKINCPKPKGQMQDVLQAWADEFRKLVEIDNRTLDEIKALIKWIPGSWWKGKILSPARLRGKMRDGVDKWATLVMQMRDRSGRGNGVTGGSVQTKQPWYFCSCGRRWSKQQKDTRSCYCGGIAELHFLDEREVLELQRSQ